MTVHVAGLVVFAKAPYSKLRDHFKQAVPGDGEGNSLIVDVHLNSVIIQGSLIAGTEEIPRLEAWFSNRMATLKDTIIKQAMLLAEVRVDHHPTIYYTWVRGQEPGIKAVAMEA